MIFSFPEINEQTKIGDYFQRLDALIEQKEKKYKDDLGSKTRDFEKLKKEYELEKQMSNDDY